MKNDILQEHQIKKETSEKVFGYQLSSIFLLIILIRYIVFSQLNFIDFSLLILGIILLGVSKFKSTYISPIRKFWLLISIYLAKVLNPIILMVVYILCFIPIGIIYKLIKKRNLKTEIKKTEETYWEKPEDSKINFKDQY